MSRAIREHARDFIAIIVLLIISLAVLFGILSQQRANFPDWLPFLGEDKFELKAEFTSAQAVTPGQGQTVNISGIRVGSIDAVEVQEGNAIVTMSVDMEYSDLIGEDATFLLRPRTGLQDMTMEIDTGSGDAPSIEEGATVPNSQTAPNVNPDEVLASLDADTQDFLKVLLADGATALGDRGEQLSAVFRRFEPTARDIAKFQGALASRRKNLEQVIHDFGALVEELGMKDDQLRRFVNSSNAVLGSFANQEAAIQESLREFPSTLEETQTTLASAEEFGNVVGPAARRLTPAARALAPALRAVQPLFAETLDPIRDQIRPATREIGEPTRILNNAAKGLAEATPALSSSFSNLNILFNEIAYDPPGAQDESFLFWIAWLNHNTNAVSTLQDANGPLLRGIVTITCGNTRLAEQVANQRPFLRLLYDLTLTPSATEICPPSNLPFRENEPDRERDLESSDEQGNAGSDPSPAEPSEPSDAQGSDPTGSPQETTTTTTTPQPPAEPTPEPDAAATTTTPEAAP